jgi:acetylornithine deacetylase/succinyl-diaminopimelate desuccinylase-like protein
MTDPTIKLLRDLVAIDSVNPSLVPGGAGEREIASFVAAEMRSTGMDVEITEVAPGRPNVVGVLDSRTPGRSLMFFGSLIEGGRELSTYPDRCVLKMERRTIVGEPAEVAFKEAEDILAALAQEDPDFHGSAQLMFSRPAYETPEGHDLPSMLESILKDAGRGASRAGMTYWTDAAILGQAGIPSVIFGPGGAGYHSLEEYVRVDDVMVCREALAKLAIDFCV